MVKHISCMFADSLRLRRRRAFIANVGGQLVLIVPTAQRRPQTRVASPRINQVSLSMRGIPPSGGLRAQIGVVSPQVASTQVAQSPPGVQFLGQGSQQGIMYVDNIQRGLAAPAVRTVPPANNANSQIPNSNLKISGINQKGELIITGPGGSITIGTDLLNGISRQNAMPMFTEFEEMELEGMPNANVTGGGQGGQPNRFELNQQGRGSIIIERAPHVSSSGPVIVDPHLATSGGAVSSASSASSSASAGGASASSSASSSAGGASASASSSAGSASSSSSSSAVSMGNGISLESGGQIIRLGQSAGKTQTITLGGAGGIQLSEGGSGIQVPGNATFIVGG